MLALVEEREQGRVLFVEWGAPFMNALGGDAVVVEFRVSPRVAHISAMGPRAAACVEGLEP